MHVIELPIGDIHRYQNNPRRNAATVFKVAASIRAYGFLQPVVVDKHRVIVVGDTRYQAAESLALATVPCVVAEHLTEAQAAAYRLADNRIGEDSEWDDARLIAEIDRLAKQGFPLDSTGFEEIELADMLARELVGVPAMDPDDLPVVDPAAGNLPPVPISRAGDVWVLGGHRLICGDCTNPSTVAALLGRDRPQLMVTDPPYGVVYDAGWRDAALPAANKRATGKVHNDNAFDWRLAWALFPGKIAYVYHADRHSAQVVASLRAVGLNLRQILVWVKSRIVIGRSAYQSQHEPVAVASRGEDLPFTVDTEFLGYAVRDGETGDWKGGRKQSTVWNISHVKSETGHSTQKPVECMRRPIVNHTDEDAFVYEPFSGSGTTIIAGEITRRRVLAVEIMPEYVDLAVRRWQAFANGSAILSASTDAALVGKSFADVEHARRGDPAPAVPVPAPKRARAKKQAS